MSQRSTHHITLRPAIAIDAEWGADLLFASGPELFSYAFASPSQEAAAILRQAFSYPKHAFSYDYAQVIEVADEPAGLMLSYPGSVKRKADEQSHQVMAKLLSLRKLPRILVNLADLTRIKQDVTQQDYYIFSLIVRPSFRNQGLGSYLLAQAEKQAYENGCKTLCLDVTYTNTRAKHLFERTGYRVGCSKTTPRFEQMTRAGGLYRMVKNLT